MVIRMFLPRDLCMSCIYLMGLMQALGFSLNGGPEWTKKILLSIDIL